VFQEGQRKAWSRDSVPLCTHCGEEHHDPNLLYGLSRCCGPHWTLAQVISHGTFRQRINLHSRVSMNIFLLVECLSWKWWWYFFQLKEHLFPVLSRWQWELWKYSTSLEKNVMWMLQGCCVSLCRALMKGYFWRSGKHKGMGYGLTVRTLLGLPDVES
jgi:hypothetical protein